MANVIPSLRTSLEQYPATCGTRTSGANAPTPSGPALDFQTVLNQQPIPAPAAPTAVSRTMGTITVSSTTPAVASPVAIGPAMAPSAQSLFGANPWFTDAGGKGPNGSYSYNPYYFATPETGAKVAQIMGGKVVEAYAITPYGPFTQNHPNQMVQMPDGRLINAGIIASYYDRGLSQQAVDSIVNGEINNIPT